jgi:hypothetical protein
LHDTAVEYALFPMVRHLRGATVCCMIGRSPSSLLASLLVFAQLLTGPLLHAAPLADEDCGPIGQTSHTAAGGLADSGDCPDGNQHCRTHAACTCPCAHTPALGSFRPVIASPTPPEGVSRVLAVPAFDPPLFDFLRPPN